MGVPRRCFKTKGIIIFFGKISEDQSYIIE
jgi:hypothetical protein